MNTGHCPHSIMPNNIYCNLQLALVLMQHQLYNNNIDLKDIEENCERIKIEIISFIKGIVPHELVKVANKQSRIGYCEGDTRYCIGNT